MSVLCSFGGVERINVDATAGTFERFVPNKNPGIVIVNDTCTVTAGYVDVDSWLCPTTTRVMIYVGFTFVLEKY